MNIKKAYMDKMGRYCSNCAHCERLDGVPISISDCESPRLLKTSYDCEHGATKYIRPVECRHVYGTMRCIWKKVEA